ncbi:hypothetical protein PWT90_07710 [Aphanocladium album]|nr:hypothetical protein PWT90_07710 [Aphanocladium album]
MKLSLAVLWTAACGIAAPTQTQPEYEYIIIGSGPGGGPLAANLARAGHSVLLLEAGGDTGESLLQQVPAWSTLASETPGMAWSFFVNHYEDQAQAQRDNKYTYLLSNGSYYVGLDPPSDAKPLGILYPRGATVGGSSQVNAMNFALPPDNDWRHIADLTGDASWRPEKMRNLFVEIEKNGYLPDRQPGHGKHGFVSTNLNNVSYVTSRRGVSLFVQKAVQELEGVLIEDEKQLVEKLGRDINTIDTRRYEKPGVYSMPLHIDAERRRSGARNYIARTVAARTKNGSPKYPLTLSTHSLVSRVLFRNGTAPDQKPRAYGVEYLVGEGLYAADGRFNATQNGELRTAIASREVIVSGGSFNTPQILKLSGVGPQEELKALGIPVIAHVPAVGSYMQDNYEGGVTVRANVPYENNPFANCQFNTTPGSSPDACLQQWQQGFGPYGEGGAPLSMWFRSSVSENKDCDVFLFGAASAEFRGYFPGFSRGQVPDSNFFWSMVKMQTGNQAGTVTLRSNNPRDTPLINFNFFQQHGDRDLQALSEAHDMVLRVFNATGQPYAPFVVAEPHSGADTKQALKDYTFSHHVSSTCRMGPKNHSDYCVDSEFRVNGVDGLRVVDASVFPRTPGAFPVAPTFLISQKAFHLLHRDHRDGGN